MRRAAAHAVTQPIAHRFGVALRMVNRASPCVWSAHRCAHPRVAQPTESPIYVAHLCRPSLSPISFVAHFCRPSLVARLSHAHLLSPISFAHLLCRPFLSPISFRQSLSPISLAHLLSPISVAPRFGVAPSPSPLPLLKGLRLTKLCLLRKTIHERRSAKTFCER